MCGIIAEFNTKLKKKNKKDEKTKKVNDEIVNQYQDQYSRGTKGFGIIRIDEKGNIQVDRATEELKFMLDLYLKPSTMIIAHHRQPTSSENKMNQTHPIFITNSSLHHHYYFIHNGVVSNDKKLKEKHDKLGFHYTTEYTKEPYYSHGTAEQKFNDSEALGIEVALFIEGKQDTIQTDNTAAFIALQVDRKTLKATRVYFGRSGSSSMLKMFKVKGNLKLSSEGEGEDIDTDILFSFDTKDPKMKLEKREMEFKKPEEEVRTPIVTHSHTTTRAVEGTKLTENLLAGKTQGESELVVIEERAWSKTGDEDPTETTEYNFEEEEEIFVSKNYKEETKQTFKETIKDDDSTMIETSLDIALDEQTEKIGKMISNLQATLVNRKIDGKERGEYLSQIFKVIDTMEAITDIAEEDYKDKTIEEQIKLEDNYDDSSVGFRMGKRVHNYRTGEMEDITGDLNYDQFGR